MVHPRNIPAFLVVARDWRANPVLLASRASVLHSRSRPATAWRSLVDISLLFDRLVCCGAGHAGWFVGSTNMDFHFRRPAMMVRFRLTNRWSQPLTAHEFTLDDFNTEPRSTARSRLDFIQDPGFPSAIRAFALTR
jgi:hypothetical protein